MTTGVVLMTYGSPQSQEPGDVASYITRVRGGHPPTDEVLAEFCGRYRAISGSPLVETTRRQAHALQGVLAGEDVLVQAGMRFSKPSIEWAVDALAGSGARHLIGLILSPQYSPLLMSGYEEALAAAAPRLGCSYHMVRTWHEEPAFVQALAARVRTLYQQRVQSSAAHRVHVLLTAHSLPRRVVDREPDYVEQMCTTAGAVAAASGLPPDRWSFSYQSAGHTPEEWLKPDMLEVLPQLAAQGVTDVIVAPVQFLADHLETLYDIDLAGSRQAATSGIAWFGRVPAFNDSPDFIAVLAAVVRHSRESGWPEAAQPPVWVPA